MRWNVVFAPGPPPPLPFFCLLSLLLACTTRLIISITRLLSWDWELWKSSILTQMLKPIHMSYSNSNKLHQLTEENKGNLKTCAASALGYSRCCNQDFCCQREAMRWDWVEKAWSLSLGPAYIFSLATVCLGIKLCHETYPSLQLTRSKNVRQLPCLWS